MDIELFHCISSRLPAFNVIFTQNLPQYFNLQDVDDNLNIDKDRNNLVINYNKLDLNESIHVDYYVNFDADTPDDVVMNITSTLAYTNLIYMPQRFTLKVKVWIVTIYWTYFLFTVSQI